MLFEKSRKFIALFEKYTFQQRKLYFLGFLFGFNATIG